MKLSRGIHNFWFEIGSILLSGLVLFLSVLWRSGWRLSSLLSLPSLAGLIVGFSLLMFHLIWWLSDLKSQMLQAMPDEWQFQVAVLTDYPLLNLGWLHQQTSILESLGFMQLMDYQVKPGNGFARRFAHPQQYCFASVGQVFKSTGETIAQLCSIFSILEQDWVVVTINREVNHLDAIAYIWRHPKAVRSYHPNISLDELLQSHLRFRQQMLTDLGITVSTDVSWDAYRTLEQQATIFRKQTFRRKNLLQAMLEATLFEINPKSEWLGDYPKLAAKRRANTL